MELVVKILFLCSVSVLPLAAGIWSRLQNRPVSGLIIATIPFVFLLLGFSFLLMMAGSNLQTVGQVLIALMGIFVLFYAVGLFVGRFRPAGVAGQKSGNIFS